MILLSINRLKLRAMRTGEETMSAATDRLHIGNRWINHAGLGYYDNTARYFDALTVRFTAPDLLEWKYYSLSPWAHCAGNPVNLIDPDGNDICVIYYHELPGHVGILIQHSDKRWYLYSKNGARYSASSSGGSTSSIDEDWSSGEHLADIGEMSFSSPDEFFASEYNQSRSDPYEKGLIYETTPAQDQAAIDAITIELNKPYNLFSSNCVVAVCAALNALKIDDILKITQDGNWKDTHVPYFLFSKLQEETQYVRDVP